MNLGFATANQDILAFHALRIHALTIAQIMEFVSTELANVKPQEVDWIVLSNSVLTIVQEKASVLMGLVNATAHSPVMTVPRKLVLSNATIEAIAMTDIANAY